MHKKKRGGLISKKMWGGGDLFGGAIFIHRVETGAPLDKKKPKKRFN